MLPRDTYHQPGVADPVLDEQTVCGLARRHVPGAAQVTGVDESGGEARTYAVDKDIILKTQRPHRVRPRTSLEKEVFFLKRLAAYPEISVPRVLGYGREGGVEYICMSRMAGVAACTVGPGGPGEDEAAARGRTDRVLQASAAQAAPAPVVTNTAGSGPAIGPENGLG